ncbi:MAG TPA: hypothetical protein PKC38_04875, partial [Chitinophagales bacterium]|nr:hypothetical protein [Chitinophagales bacterium]
AISRSKYNQQFLPQLMHLQPTLLNSLNAELDSMRITMAFTGLEVIAYNLSHKQSDLNLFEFGRVYHKTADAYREPEVLAFYKTGNVFAESWRIQQRKTGFYDLKEQVEKLMLHMGVKASWKPVDETHPLRPLFEQAVTVSVGNEVIGICGGIHNAVLQSFGIKQAVWFAEINWQPLLLAMASRKVIFKEINKYPEMRRDLALVLDADVEYQSIAAIARQEGKQILREVNLFDVFEGEQLAGRKSYAIGLTFNDSTRTLTDSEVDAVMQRLISRYEKEFNAVIRK